MEKLSWTIHRARDAPVRTAVVVVFVVAFLAFALWYFGVLLTLVAVLVLFVATHTYFLPITYTFGPDGVTVNKRLFSHTYPWDQFRRYFRTTGGIVLSPFSRRTFLDNFRGIHLLLPRDPEEQVDYLERRFNPSHDS